MGIKTGKQVDAEVAAAQIEMDRAIAATLATLAMMRAVLGK